jgi:predicted DsbA family dithiol-disulfide isomerase
LNRQAVLLAGSVVVMVLPVDVISDVICPWCYIGKRRLEKAVAALGGPLKVRWLPLQLNPTMAKDGIGRREYRTKKLGSWERSLALDATVIEVGKSEGIHFAYVPPAWSGHLMLKSCPASLQRFKAL